MSTEYLHAWVCGEYAGRFERDFEMDRPRFVYAAESEQQLSLSIPRSGIADSLAPRLFLDNLLPELPGAREQILRATSARSTETWELLSAIGGDLSGGLVLHPDENGPKREEPFTRLTNDEAISARITSVKHGGTGLEPAEGMRIRFSLAGAQAKFAIAKAGDTYFWPDSATPSTHIIKPESAGHDGLELIEAATLELARSSGVPTPLAEQAFFAGESAFQIERFDRISDPRGVTRRVHAEDMTQALGIGPADKYDVSADDIVKALREATGDDDLGYQFYRQFAFNSLIGNADAHAKNYSLLYTEHGIVLSPLYDAIPIGMFPDHDTSLSMPVGWNEQFTSVTADDWIESARQSGLDPDRVLSTVQDVAAGIRTHLDSTLGEVEHPRVNGRTLGQIRAAAELQVAPAGTHPSHIVSKGAG